MKILLSLFSFIVSLECFSQNNTELHPPLKTKIVTIIEERTVKLDSRYANTWSAGNKMSRIFIPVTLPPKTRRWYYTFTTVKDGSSFNENLNLAIQVGALISPYSKIIGIAKYAVSNIKVPQGSCPINSFLYDARNINLFMDRQQAYYLSETDMQHTTEGKLLIKEPRKGTYYLGLENLSDVNDVLIKIEVVAVVADVD